jgi:ribosomal protein L37AE/L43A
MLGIDIALLAGGGALLVVAAALIGGRFGARGEARRRREQGERNAELEKQRLDERCAVCGESVDPAHDVFDNGRWWHQTCFREAVK